MLPASRLSPFPSTATTERLRTAACKQVGQCLCGIASSAIALTALTPRTHTEAEVLSDRRTTAIAKLDPATVELSGLTLPELARLLRAHGCTTTVATHADAAGLEAFRTAVRRCCTNESEEDGAVLLANYHMAELGQSDVLGGHISPIGGYYAADDGGQEYCLLLDVWPENDSCWVPIADMHQAMLSHDTATRQPRGFVEVSMQPQPQQPPQQPPQEENSPRHDSLQTTDRCGVTSFTPSGPSSLSLPTDPSTTMMPTMSSTVASPLELHTAGFYYRLAASRVADDTPTALLRLLETALRNRTPACHSDSRSGRVDDDSFGGPMPQANFLTILTANECCDLLMYDEPEDTAACAAATAATAASAATAATAATAASAATAATAASAATAAAAALCCRRRFC